MGGRRDWRKEGREKGRGERGRGDLLQGLRGDRRPWVPLHTNW